jgi:hypothetical protein
MKNPFFPNYEKPLITSRFGMRFHPVDKRDKMHNGIDMTATNDGHSGHVDHICAHTGGTVENVGFGDSVGYYINIRVDSDTVMVYRHLRAKPTLQVGETVKTGQVIGYMGKSGKATGAHLHWGIKRAGEWIDPTPYLDADYPVEPEDKTFTLELRVLRRGCKGEDVKGLQRYLLGCGYYLGKTGPNKDGVDGSYGAKTENAVECLQEDTNGILVPNGVAGPKTQKYIHGQGVD